ncbi:MFS transporter [Kineosporia succinea]|uniref:MFS family permease n=1 Tax=Kineosporia succinea TaxID=84632 RepID=A0ABT9P2F7_9ACTN|nr:MFS transporter [Kineosporia succinea]MDP9826870.1 MFS family permease [Kineosporia succinea]
MTNPINARRWALFALFFLPGVAIASWVTRTPAIRDALGATTQEMGFVLFGLSVGSMLAILSSGPLVLKFGARPLIAAGTTSIVVSLPVIALGAQLGEPLLVTAGLFLFGAGVGGGEVAMNVEGAEVEKLTGRPFLPMLHGCFSLGTFVGALIGILFTTLDFPVTWHLVIVTGLAAALFGWAIRVIPAGTGKSEGLSRTGDASVTSGLPAHRPPWKDTRLLLIGAIVLAMALAEGTANDWLPLLMVDGHGFDAGLGSAIYATFALSMTVGRFVGGRFIDRYGRGRVLMASAISATAGLALVSLADLQALAAAGVILWGLGASLGFPVALSAAGDSGPDSAARVTLVATVGYIAFLVGPPLLGFLGEHYGLRGALIVPLVFAAGAVFVARAADPVPEKLEPVNR